MVASNHLRDAGVVASVRAAEIYGLNVLAQGIQVHLFWMCWVYKEHVKEHFWGLVLSYFFLISNKERKYMLNAECVQATMLYLLLSKQFLQILISETLQDDQDSITRFLILARDPIIPKIDKTFKVR